MQSARAVVIKCVSRSENNALTEIPKQTQSKIVPIELNLLVLAQARAAPQSKLFETVAACLSLFEELFGTLDVHWSVRMQSTRSAKHTHEQQLQQQQRALSRIGTNISRVRGTGPYCFTLLEGRNGRHTLLDLNPVSYTHLTLPTIYSV